MAPHWFHDIQVEPWLGIIIIIVVNIFRVA